eukprot:3224166-Pleurochrysis_carterae.AAC.1
MRRRVRENALVWAGSCILAFLIDGGEGPAARGSGARVFGSRERLEGASKMPGGPMSGTYR